MQQHADLRAILSTGLCLVDIVSTGSSDLKDILLTRLARYYIHSGRCGNANTSSSLDEVELETAHEALYVVEEIQKILANPETLDDPLSIGTRDLAQIGTLISIAFKWGVDPLFIRVTSSWPSTGKTIPSSNDYQFLSTLVSRFMVLLFPDGERGPLTRTHITTTILNQYMTNLLRPCMAIGWLPKSLVYDSVATSDFLRPLVTRSLANMPSSHAISTLGMILTGPPHTPLHVHQLCTSLLSKQLLRSDGIYGLCTAIFEEDELHAPLEKLEHIARVLSAVPARMKPGYYFRVVVPRILMLLSQPVPPAHRRAAAFALSRMLASGDNFRHQTVVSNVLLPILHSSFLHAVPFGDQDGAGSPPDAPLAVSAALYTLMNFLTNADPSPIILSILLSPIVPAFYTLLFHLEHAKTSDPGLTASLRGLLATWGRTASPYEGVEILLRIVAGEGGEWETDPERNPKRVERSHLLPPLSFLTPEDLHRVEDTVERDVDLNVLGLRPDPIFFVSFVKSMDRADISPELFVKLLEKYGEVKSTGEDPRRALLYLQLIIQMQAQLSEANTPSNILSKPEHLLSFVKNALESAVATPPSDDQDHEAENGSWIENLRIVPKEDQASDGVDSDDEDSDTAGSASNNEITSTAINLLLSILEANPNLSANVAPVLNDVFSLLEPLANEISHPVRPLAREARMVMTARLASTSLPQRSCSKKAGEDLQEMYQKALKLLQDPILPVRAHGLLLLRQLVSPRSSTDAHVDEALIPAILSIFLQSIQDDDSYIFLNAVQGLAAMVDTFGKEVLKGLVNMYSQRLDGINGGNLTQNEVDKRIRIGEALGQIIRKCGGALSIYVDIIAPPLFIMVGSSEVPTTLRTSAISLLAECQITSPLALLRFSTELFNTMIDLLQLESIRARDLPNRPGNEPFENEENEAVNMDSQPTSTNSKFPPLRRAALHFLSLHIRATTAQIYDSAFEELSLPLGRASTTLSYVATTDEDLVVRVMAQEAIEDLGDLRRAMAGI